MAAAPPGLTSLLLALFEKPDELIRFVRYQFGERVVADVDRKGSSTSVATQVGEELQVRGLVDADLFRALRKNRPERVDVIDQVERELLGTDPDEPPQSNDEPADTDRPKSQPDDDDRARSAWRALLHEHLEGAHTEVPPLPDEWMQAIAVIAAFDPTTIAPTGGSDTPVPRDLVARLTSVCDRLPDGTMCLRSEERQRALAPLMEDDAALVAALDANPGLDTLHGRYLRALADGWRIPVHELATTEELAAAAEVASWLAPFERYPFDPDQIVTVLNRRRRLAPLQRLTGNHFRGREAELAELRAHLNSADGSPILSIQGIGGMGKSALIGKVVLDLEDLGARQEPWLYLDFDDPEVDPLRPTTVVTLIARQLAELFAGSAAAENFISVESVSSGDDLVFDAQLDPHAPVDQLLATVADALHHTTEWTSAHHRVTVVFDTFEQVQIRGDRAVAQVRSLIDALVEAMPYARIVVSGRAPIRQWQDVKVRRLGGLDPESADEVLEALGVGNAAARHYVIETLGTQPLLLRLVAVAVTSGSIDLDDLEAVATQAQRASVEGALYVRILGHIRDGEIRRLAHPGLVVRRVTVELLREVLAEPCQLEQADLGALFARLPDRVDLFEPGESAAGEGAALRHRPDLRATMVRLMDLDPDSRPMTVSIHERARAYYVRRSDDIAVAERIYHHLMLDGDPAEVDPLWSQQIAIRLASALDDPLPERARTWLEARLGSIDVTDVTRQEDREVIVEREARALLDTGDASAALAQIEAVAPTASGATLLRLEIEALHAVGRPADAAAKVPAALERAVALGRLDEAFEIHLLAASVERKLSHAEQAADHLASASAIAHERGDSSGLLRAQIAQVMAAIGSPDGGQLADFRTELERSLIAVDPSTLVRHEDLAREALGVLESDSTPLLEKLALTFGNRADQGIVTQDAFVMTNFLNQVVESTPAEESDLRSLFQFSVPEATVTDMARSAVLGNKVGDMLLTVLATYGDDESVRASAANLFPDLDLPYRAYDV